MGKSVKEKALEWGCSKSTVKSYCSSGIIPPAEKTGNRGAWMIPDDWPKPPMTRHGLCFLLDTIYQLNCGVSYQSIKWGYQDKQVVDGYNYLVGAAFMSSIDTNELSNTLVSATVTPRGEKLIERENYESKGKTSFKAHIVAKANVGLGSIEVDAEAAKEI